MSGFGPEETEDLELVQSLTHQIRERIQAEVDALIHSRTSVWFG